MIWLAMVIFEPRVAVAMENRSPRVRRETGRPGLRLTTVPFRRGLVDCAPGGPRDTYGPGAEAPRSSRPAHVLRFGPIVCVSIELATGTKVHQHVSREGGNGQPVLLSQRGH